MVRAILSTIRIDSYRYRTRHTCTIKIVLRNPMKSLEVMNPTKKPEHSTLERTVGTRKLYSVRWATPPSRCLHTIINYRLAIEMIQSHACSVAYLPLPPYSGQRLIAKNHDDDDDDGKKQAAFFRSDAPRRSLVRASSSPLSFPSTTQTQTPNKTFVCVHSPPCQGERELR